MYETTFGQVYALFDNLAQYLILTNPWGSSDDDAKENFDPPELDRAALPKVDTPSAEPSSLVLARSPAISPVIDIKRRADLPADTRELLEIHERDNPLA